LALGLAFSFAVIGTLVASVGFAVGIDQDVLRQFAAVVLLAFAMILLVPALQERFAVFASGLSSAGNGMLSHVNTKGLAGQFMLGLLLGLVWTPCVGPTLGAAITLASQGQELGKVAGVMGVFGLGAGLPLMLLGMLSRNAMLKLRASLFKAGSWGKQLLGGVLLVVAILILSGGDKQLEAYLVQISPAWLTDLTTRF
jgi:cytochrome c biogenesis protein CcdA